jgi:hypothetical protein
MNAYSIVIKILTECLAVCQFFAEKSVLHINKTNELDFGYSLHAPPGGGIRDFNYWIPAYAGMTENYHFCVSFVIPA